MENVWLCVALSSTCDDNVVIAVNCDTPGLISLRCGHAAIPLWLAICAAQLDGERIALALVGVSRPRLKGQAANHDIALAVRGNASSNVGRALRQGSVPLQDAV